MNDDQFFRRPALVVATSDAEREECCRVLSRHGYSPVGFADCANAAAWLEEETPTIAILSANLPAACEKLLPILADRDVEAKRADHDNDCVNRKLLMGRVADAIEGSAKAYRDANSKLGPA